MLCQLIPLAQSFQLIAEQLSQFGGRTQLLLGVAQGIGCCLQRLSEFTGFVLYLLITLAQLFQLPIQQCSQFRSGAQLFRKLLLPA
ncbi:hypothetical protein D3C73_1437520 [compost metagenome]